MIETIAAPITIGVMMAVTTAMASCFHQEDADLSVLAIDALTAALFCSSISADR
jgi:hypothetical protein